MNTRLRRPLAGKLPYRFRLGIILILAIAFWGLILWLIGEAF